MKVAVTGGAGFIGANLCRQLAASSLWEEVRVVDDLSTGNRENLKGVDVAFYQGSVLDRDLLGRALAGVDAIVHLAALPSVPRSIENPVAAHRANASGTVSVLEAARRMEGVHVIVASSSSVYGATEGSPKEEGMATRPMSPYAASKLATEAYALAYHYSFGLPVLAFRFFNVFGPLQPAGHAYAAVVPSFISHALRGEPLPLFGDGKQSRDFTFVGSVTRVLADALARRVTSLDPVNLAFGTRTDLLSLISLLEEVLGKELAVQKLPPRPGDVRHSQADSSRLRALFPEVEPVDLRTGLEETLAWFRHLGEGDPNAGT